MNYTVFCSGCKRIFSDSGKYLYTCPDCGSILDIQYNLDLLLKEWKQNLLVNRTKGIRRWRELLPIKPGEELISMGEGETPLVEAPEASLGCSGIRLLLKLESCNPSGSFKDRAISVAVSKAQAAGISVVVISSSGNAGTSAAAYCAFLRLPCIVLVPKSTPTPTLAQIAALGAQLIRVEGDVSFPFNLAKDAAEQFGWGNLATTFLSPYPTEGDKTVGFEIALQLDWQVPDWIFVPVGAGPLLYACYKAFVELQTLGLVERIPRLAAVQAAGCAPIYRAWQAGEEKVTNWGVPKTVAKGIADPLRGYPQDGTFTLQAVRSSGGLVLSVTDAEILTAREDLMRYAGMLAEPTAAAPLAGLRQMVDTGRIGERQTVVLLITGHGLKEIPRKVADVPIIPSDLDALSNIVKRYGLGEG